MPATQLYTSPGKVRWWFELLPTAVGSKAPTLLGRRTPERSPAAALADDLALLRGQNQRDFTANQEVMQAAERVFAEMDFMGHTQAEVLQWLGAPLEKINADTWHLAVYVSQWGTRRLPQDDLQARTSQEGRDRLDAIGWLDKINPFIFRTRGESPGSI